VGGGGWLPRCGRPRTRVDGGPSVVRPAVLQPCLLREPRGRATDAVGHLRHAIGLSEQFRSYAKGDSDFDPIRDESAFKELIGG
jgi:hypothetical protein